MKNPVRSRAHSMQHSSAQRSGQQGHATMCGLLLHIMKPMSCVCVQCAGKKTHYDVLGIDVGASDDDVKAAYRRAAKELHPDVNDEVCGCVRTRACACARVRGGTRHIAMGRGVRVVHACVHALLCVSAHPS